MREHLAPDGIVVRGEPGENRERVKLPSGTHGPVLQVSGPRRVGNTLRLLFVTGGIRGVAQFAKKFRRHEIGAEILQIGTNACLRRQAVEAELPVDDPQPFDIGASRPLTSRSLSMRASRRRMVSCCEARKAGSPVCRFSS